MDYAKLRAEVLTDPVGLGYAGKTNDAIAVILNDTGRGRTLPRTNITKNEITRSIAPADFPTTSAQDQIKLNKLNFVMSTDTIDASSPNIRQFFADIFAGKPTLSVLQALSTRPVSRAEEIGLDPPTAEDVRKAVNMDW